MSYQFHKISYYNLYNFTQFSIIQFSYNFSYDIIKKKSRVTKANLPPLQLLLYFSDY